MSTLNKVLVGATVADETLFPLLEFDNQILRGETNKSLCLIDFSKNYCFGGDGTKAVNATYKELVDDVTGAVVNTEGIQIVNGGLVLNNTVYQKLSMPSNYNLDATTRGAVMHCWAKFAVTQDAGASATTQTLFVASNIEASCGIGFYNGNVIGSLVYAGGALSFGAKNDGQLHLFTLVLKQTSSTAYKQYAYVDGVLISSSSSTSNYPVTAHSGYKRIGYNSIESVSSKLNAKKYRNHLILTDGNTFDHEASIQSEYTANYTRLKALSDLDV